MISIKTGGVQMIPIDNGHRVWTKRFGSGSIPLLTLHGGPGCTHEYFECFEDFPPQHDIQIIYYDQLGSAYSDQPNDPSLWTLERFREEVEQVRRALGLEHFYMLGHSWGGMLGIEYALKYQQHLKGLIISNMTASIPAYVAYINELRQQLPPDIIRLLEKYEATGDYEAPEYEQTLLKYVYTKHLCRLDPWPEPLVRMFRNLAKPVYNTMQGPNEFVVNGTFKDWDRWADLHGINCPSLISGARFDTMRVSEIERMGKLIPHSRLSLCENGSHCAMYDDQEAYFHDLVQFIQDVESGSFSYA